jgi:hypothetical protein
VPGPPAGSPATLARRARSVRAAAVAIAMVLGLGVAGAVVVAGRAAGPAAPASPEAASGPAGGNRPGTSSTPATAAVPPGEAVVTGTVTSVTAQDATGPPLTIPLVLTVPVRGRGGATFYNVSVGGRPSTVVWNGGEPLGVIGHGAIDAGRVDVTIDASGSTWALDGAERILAPGTYHAAAPVAVGQAGLARPQDSADFTAGSSSVVVTSGGATVHRDPQALHLIGTGPVVLDGTLQLRTGAATATVRRVVLAGGPFDVEVVPGPGGLSVRATLGGPVTTG